MKRSRLPGLVGLPALTVVQRVLVCSGCGESALHVEMWEGADEPHGLPLELGRCDCGGFWLQCPSGEEGDAVS